MTVRVNKQPFNIREKLSELERPIGIKGHELMGAETTQDARELVSAGRKNLVINGDMRISQRATTFNPAPTSSGSYTIDRFCTQSSQSNNFTVSQDSSSPSGFLNNWKVTMGTATTLDYMRLITTVEGYHFKQASAFGTSSAQYLTLSFWVKSSLTGTFGVGFRNGTTIGGTGLSTSYLATYTINAANTWEYKTITIPPNTTATWGSANNIGFLILWDLGDSSTRSSSTTDVWQTSNNYYPCGLTDGTKVASVTGATWQITGIQLEVGRSATDFEHRSYGEEIALCHRYFWQPVTSQFTATSSATWGAMGISYSANSYYIPVQFPTAMRIPPSVGGDGTWRTRRNNLNSFTTTFGIHGNGNVNGCILGFSGGSIGAAEPFWFEAHSTDANLFFNAEL